MNISSTPFIRNDYWPDYNDINMLNQRIDEAENETSLVNARLTNDIENVSNNLNSYKNEMADTVITNNIIVNNLNANYAVGKYANFINTNTDNAYIENLTVNKPVFDLTLNTPHVENITSIGGNFYDANLFNVAVENITGSINDSTITDSTLVNAILDGNGVLGNVEINNTVINTANVAELFVNTSLEPITSSAVLGYDSEGRVIPIKAAFDVGFPEDANYLYTDQYGTAFPGTAETEVNASNNLITSNAVYNALANVNNSFNNVNNTANNLLDNVDYLKNIVESFLLPANITGWSSSTYPVIIQGITEFAVEPLSADYYPITPESDRIRFNGSYYEKNGNNYVKQDVTTYNTYDDSIYVNWNNEYLGETTLDESTFEDITVWKTKSGTIATSGYYLSYDEKPDGTYIVQLLNLTFDAKGVYSGNIIFDALYKLPSDFNFQDSVTYYLKNNNNFEGLKVNQGQCTFTTDPTTDNNFYIYQKGADWSYPNTTGPAYSILAQNNVYAAVYNASDFPLYTEMGTTMTAYVGDKAKLSVSGTKAALALPGLQWTMENMVETFEGCTKFNQNVQIPNGVTSMVNTFQSCVEIPQTYVPDTFTNAYDYVNNSLYNAVNATFNQNIKLPSSLTNMSGIFGFTAFNQNIVIPEGVTDMSRALSSPYMRQILRYASNNAVVRVGGSIARARLYIGQFNQNITIPNSVANLKDTFAEQVCFNQNILIPNSVVDMSRTFTNCVEFNQNILIPNSVTNISNMLLGPNLSEVCKMIKDNIVSDVHPMAFNQSDMYIYSQNITDMDNAFNGCHINNIHIPTSVPKDTSNFMYNCLVNGNTGITFPAANIFNDLPVDIEQWPPV